MMGTEGLSGRVAAIGGTKAVHGALPIIMGTGRPHTRISQRQPAIACHRSGLQVGQERALQFWRRLEGADGQRTMLQRSQVRHMQLQQPVGSACARMSSVHTRRCCTAANWLGGGRPPAAACLEGSVW